MAGLEGKWVAAIFIQLEIEQFSGAQSSLNIRYVLLCQYQLSPNHMTVPKGDLYPA